MLWDLLLQQPGLPACRDQAWLCPAPAPFAEKKGGIWRICNEPPSPGTRPGTWKGMKFINQTVFRGMKQQTLKPVHQTALPNGLEGAESAGCFKLLFFSEKRRKRYAEPDKLTPGAQGKLHARSTLGKRGKSFQMRKQNKINVGLIDACASGSAQLGKSRSTSKGISPAFLIEISELVAFLISIHVH